MHVSSVIGNIDIIPRICHHKNMTFISSVHYPGISRVKEAMNKQSSRSILFSRKSDSMQSIDVTIFSSYLVCVDFKTLITADFLETPECFRGRLCHPPVLWDQHPIVISSWTALESIVCNHPNQNKPGNIFVPLIKQFEIILNSHF